MEYLGELHLLFSIHTNLEWWFGIPLGQIIFFLLSFRTDSSLKQPDSIPQNTVFMVSGGKFELVFPLLLSHYSLESRVKETVHKAFWDNLKEQLSKVPPDYSHAVKLLQEIKETLLALLLPRQTRLKSQIEEALDIELIKQEAEHGALNIPSLTTYILGTMAMLCAPIRDEEIQSLRIMSDPVHLLREIFRVLNLMKMDMVNFTIQSLRPHLLEHSVQYERKKFQELLNKLPGRYQRESNAHLLDHFCKLITQSQTL
uniref:T-complex 11 n=1 Tax=Pseudonaja textilis TaxID=8673 RepID=A0A670ZGV8_PSETE